MTNRPNGEENKQILGNRIIYLISQDHTPRVRNTKARRTGDDVVEFMNSLSGPWSAAGFHIIIGTLPEKKCYQIYIPVFTFSCGNCAKQIIMTLLVLPMVPVVPWLVQEKSALSFHLGENKSSSSSFCPLSAAVQLVFSTFHTSMWRALHTAVVEDWDRGQANRRCPITQWPVDLAKNGVCDLDSIRVS